ncbi:siderophore-interacting protein [Chachezhania sediminis]|uniref:siderophore-interacting protein n=1 Tax=Chachezhania sediminis TaxID=2599291 RepID=UPI0018EF075F|nr:siderophore-interacting protein [Chachezhania sediminis]
MTSAPKDVVRDPKGILEQDDHIRDMERTAMEVVAIGRPFASVARVTGRVPSDRPEAWARPNVAIRIDVETPEGERPVNRIYTVRSFDAATSLIEIDFVLHEDDSPAMRWLAKTRPGDTASLIGPRNHFVPPCPPGRKTAIFADDTAIPAVYAILSAWPVGAEGEVWVETATREAFDELPDIPGVSRHLLLRRADMAPGTGRLLIGAATDALADPAGWTLWAAGERQEMKDMRSHFQAAGMARADIQILGYWRLGTSSSDLDRIRLTVYEAIRARNLPMEALDDADLPI